MKTSVEFVQEKYNIKDIKTVDIQIRKKENGGKWINGNDFTIEELNKIHRSDFRLTPEKDFEIGDWVIEYNSIIKITSENLPYYDGTNFKAQNTSSKHWHPYTDEIIWDKHLRTLGKVITNIDSIITYEDLLKKSEDPFLTSEKQVEPYFQNKLPTFIKIK